MTKTITKWYKVFGFKVFEWEVTIKVTPEYIETNVADSDDTEASQESEPAVLKLAS